MGRKEKIRPNESSNTIYIRNLPYDTDSKKLENVFGEVGPIRRCFVVTEKGSKICNGNGYVTYSMDKDASNAMKMFRHKKFNPSALREMVITPSFKKDRNRTESSRKEKDEVSKEKKKREEKAIEIKEESEEEEEESPPSKKKSGKGGKEEIKEESEVKIKEEPLDSDEEQVIPAETKQESVKPKEKKKKVKHIQVGDDQKGRIIIRNISWAINEENLRKELEKIGEVTEVRVPTLDGKKRGFAFAKFAQVEDSAKAIEQLNGTELKGRTVAVDYAVPRDKFKRVVDPLLRVKEEEESEEESEGEDKEEGEEEDDDDDEEDEGEEEEEEGEDDEEETETKKEIPTNDGFAIFVSNLAYSTDVQSIRKEFSKFGKISKVYLVKNKETGQSKGNAFVYYKKESGVEAVMKELHRHHLGTDIDETKLTDSDISLDGRILRISRQVERKEAEDQSRLRDKRNTYLLQEGYIPLNSKAANGMSARDSAKREASLQQRKMKMKNSPNFFVSKTRLSVRNVPQDMTEKKLRELFKEPVKDNKGSKILNIKIIKEKGDEGDQSKGFAFLEFSRHEDALQSLRALNNNPDTFSKTARPIVEFAVENAVKIMQSKHKRGEIEQKNPNQKSFESYHSKRKQSEPEPSTKGKGNGNQNAKKQRTKK
eukprot:TRINITY_DN5059_c0_g1_i1.p1 TRINITY_DN5059_c0_g1~~TRINITY_DN5059_c0_g1_i1.p1  ORF type:complete len:671 (-),score=276.67 TRINITY_DN5059_c0_g1_i1:19-1980(-)